MKNLIFEQFLGNLIAARGKGPHSSAQSESEKYWLVRVKNEETRPADILLIGSLFKNHNISPFLRFGSHVDIIHLSRIYFTLPTFFGSNSRDFALL